jgi:hypothetical protein
MARRPAQPEQNHAIPRFLPAPTSPKTVKLIEEMFFDPRAPKAVFFEEKAIDEFLPDAITEAKALDDFEVDGCEAALWDTLRGLGWENSDIYEQFANPALRPKCGYGLPVAYRS